MIRTHRARGHTLLPSLLARFSRRLFVRMLVTSALCAACGGCSSDLFHDTSWPSACDLDPTTAGCPTPEGADDAGDGSIDSGSYEAAD